jgi:hypothetical protein
MGKQALRRKADGRKLQGEELRGGRAVGGNLRKEKVEGRKS